jgi:hypothetical protein
MVSYAILCEYGDYIELVRVGFVKNYNTLSGCLIVELGTTEFVLFSDNSCLRLSGDLGVK